MKDRVSCAAGFMAALCLIIILLITSVEAVCYWLPGYFAHEYDKHAVLEDVHMEREDLLRVTDHMMGYLRGDKEQLQITASIEGIETTFFNQREIDHMKDVKDLFVGALKLRRICLILCAAAVCLIWKLGRMWRLPKILCAGVGIVLGIAVAMAVVISTDFTKWFTVFHHIFFDNDLWILNPATDRLINIVPEPFFIDTALNIAVIFALSLGVLLAGCLLSWRRIHRRQADDAGRRIA
ncbi:TIGR01906 family membrane protein [Ihubacter sp. rT4E-8]|uniref:TIGR01906 family membrane protein n=1 Tax=unclassified Ihubacter TaxID=2633299 RepID=UPI003C7DEF87